MYFRYSKLLILFTVLILIPNSVKSENKEPDGSFKKRALSETPIDCPLRKKGVVHDHRKPFEHTKGKERGRILIINYSHYAGDRCLEVLRKVDSDGGPGYWMIRESLHLYFSSISSTAIVGAFCNPPKLGVISIPLNNQAPLGDRSSSVFSAL